MPPRKPKPATPEARALLRAADRDWTSFQILREHPKAPTTSIGFHAQQYVEKAMKAVLVSNGVIFRRTHNLEELAALLACEGIDLPLPKAQLNRLAPFAVAGRYEDIALPSAEINAVAQMMDATRTWVGKQIHEQRDP